MSSVTFLSLVAILIGGIFLLAIWLFPKAKKEDQRRIERGEVHEELHIQG
jgi:hypothetical protein